MPHQPARHRTRPVIVGSLAVLVAAILGTGVALAASQAVSISNFAFSPQSVTVSVGDTVTWTNSDTVTHTATADDASWDAGNITGGGGTGGLLLLPLAAMTAAASWHAASASWVKRSEISESRWRNSRVLRATRLTLVPRAEKTWANSAAM